MQTKAPSILFSEMTPGPDFEDKFHRWYDEEHIPVRMACPGFVSAQRYAREDGKGYLAVYEMATLGVLSSPAYKVVKEQPSELTAWMLKNVTGFTRYLADESFVKAQPGAFDPIDAPVLYAVSFTVPAAAQAEFDSWYETEHIPLLMANPDWLMVRRLRIADGLPEPYTHLALHYLADSRALASPEREKARGTEWRARLAANDWFKASYTVFRRQGPRQLGRG
jgi:hypothetical protein